MWYRQYIALYLIMQSFGPSFTIPFKSYNQPTALKTTKLQSHNPYIPTEIELTRKRLFSTAHVTHPLLLRSILPLQIYSLHIPN